MKVAVIGTGYVGLVTGTCFSDMGNEVWCVDVDEKKIERLKAGEIPIYEPGLSELVLKNYENGNLNFSTDIKEALDRCNICFIAVGTPMGEDGSADLQYVLAVAKSIGEKMSQALNEEQLTEFENIIDNDKATVDRILGELGDYHQDPVYQQLMVNTGAGDGSIELINAYVTAKWLDKNCPTYGNMINESLEELRAEIISQKDAILAAA